jgi:Spy/CpxP family protein refolding chaperone
MKSLALITTAMWLSAAPLGAQDTTHARHAGQQPHAAMGRRMGPRGGMMDDMTPMMREMMAPMLRVTAYTPEHLLAHRDSLKLTSEQVARLTAIGDAAKSAHDAAATDFKTHMDELNGIFQATSPDTGALRPHFDAAHAAMGQAHWAMLLAAAQARAVLTDAQRQKVDAAVNAMTNQHTM